MVQLLRFVLDIGRVEDESLLVDYVHFAQRLASVLGHTKLESIIVLTESRKGSPDCLERIEVCGLALAGFKALPGSSEDGAETHG